MAYRGLDGKVAVVTGAAGGIGGAVCRRLVDEGCFVLAVDREAAGESSPVRDVGADRLRWFRADVSDEAEVDGYVQAALDAFGHIDFFHNNAAVEGPFGDLVDLDIAAFDRVMQINVRGALLGLRAVMRQLLRQGHGGVIVNAGSTGSIRGWKGIGPYIASKHAVVGLTKVAALEGASAGIRVVSVCPGPTATRMMHAIEQDMGGSADAAGVRRAIESSIPLGRYGRPEEIAATVAWVFSDDASWVTGTEYLVDGGSTAG